MIFMCTICGKRIRELETPGEGVNTDLICPACAKEIDNLLKSAKTIYYSLQKHFDRIR